MRPILGAACLALASWSAPSVAQPAAPDTYRSRAVVCQQEDAAKAGSDAMKAGGNAIDAAVATAFALAVTHPAAGNLGGGGFLVAYLADRREVVTVDFREAAPAASTERMYLGPDGKPTPGHRAGPRAAGVPGTVRGLGLAHARWGKAPWADLVRPAATLARRRVRGVGHAGPVAQRPGLPQSGRRRGPGARGPRVRPRPPGRLRRLGPRLPEGRRDALEGGRSPGPARPGRHPRPDRRRGGRRVLPRRARPGRSSPTWRSWAG